jgi:hypothetical protein
MARAWAEPFEPHEEVCLAAEQHDVGMAEWDLAPTLDEDTGWPRAFTNMPLQTHLELWTAAPHKVMTQSPYAALLVSMHGHALYARNDTLEPGTDESARVARFVANQEAFQAGLMARLGEDPERARRNQRLLWAWDFLSLALLVGWEDEALPTPDGPLEVRVAGTRHITVDPWPFAAPRLDLRCAGRRLAEPCSTPGELHARLAAAPWLTLDCALTPRG